jgi:hypothetical protein
MFLFYLTVKNTYKKTISLLHPLLNSAEIKSEIYSV